MLLRQTSVQTEPQNTSLPAHRCDWTVSLSLSASSMKHFIHLNGRGVSAEPPRNLIFRSARSQEVSFIIPYLSQSSLLLWLVVCGRGGLEWEEPGLMSCQPTCWLLSGYELHFTSLILKNASWLSKRVRFMWRPLLPSLFYQTFSWGWTKSLDIDLTVINGDKSHQGCFS